MFHVGTSACVGRAYERGTLQEQFLAPLPVQVASAGSCWGVDFGMPGNVVISPAAGAGWMPL